MTTLHEIVEWVRSSGEVHAVNRLRLKVLGTTIKEGIALNDVTPTTTCSDACLSKVRDAATAVVGSPCPH
jgi:hypothetical protein